MRNLVLSPLDFNTNDKLMLALLITLVVFAALLVVGMLFATITKIIVAATYSKYNKVKCENAQTATELTRENLDKNGLENVKVTRVSWLRGLLGLNMQGYGNSYSSYRKSIFLRKNIAEKNSITAYAVSTQKVAHAKFDSEKKHGFYYKIKPLMIFTPVLIIPFALIGLLLDFTVGNAGGPGLYTIAFAIGSLAIFTLSFVLLLITIPIEKRANELSEKILLENGQVTEQELVGIKKVNRSYILSYVADFIYAVLQVIWDILKIVLRSVANSKK